MSGGVFAVSRGIFEHEFFEDEPFTEREAWIWLIREAAWKPRKVRSPTGPITIQRGHCSCSVRFLADRWKWSKSRVGRFLHRFQKQDMIGTASGTGQMVITICKYDEYQRVSLPGGTVSETEAGQQRDRLEDREYTLTSDTNVSSVSVGSDEPTMSFGGMMGSGRRLR